MASAFAALAAPVRLIATGLLALYLLVQPLPSALAQQDEPDFSGLETRLQALSSDDLEELLVFVGGNTLFTLYHEAGHMMVSEFGLPVLGQEEDAVDNLATVTMLAAETEDMDLLLTNAMIGWFLISAENYDDLVFYDEHDLDQQRGYRMLCMMVGADEAAFLDLARDLDLPDDRIETCPFDYEQAAVSWEEVTDPFVREDMSPGGKIKVKHETAPEDLQSLALFLREAKLVETVAEELDTIYDLPEAVTFRAKTCGEENAFWEPQTRELTLCYELLGGFAQIHLANMSESAR